MSKSVIYYSRTNDLKTVTNNNEKWRQAFIFPMHGLFTNRESEISKVTLPLYDL